MQPGSLTSLQSEIIEDQELGSWIEKQEVAKVDPWGGLTPHSPGVCLSESKRAQGGAGGGEGDAEDSHSKEDLLDVSGQGPGPEPRETGEPRWQRRGLGPLCQPCECPGSRQCLIS